MEDYTYRVYYIQRHSGKAGIAVSFLRTDDSVVLYGLKELLKESPISSCPIELASHLDAKYKLATIVP